MASLVNPFNINGNYPIAGQDNDSQGFRDNFTNIKNNFFYIKQEVEDLQTKVILKNALSGTSLDNNFLGSQVKNIQTKNQSETVYDWGEVGSTTATEIQLDIALGNIHKLNARGSIKINSVIKNWPAALQYSRLLFYINIDAVSHTLELPSTITTDLNAISGLRTVSSTKLITFTDPGYYIFEFSSVDSGSTVFVRELTKGNPVFRDPNFYMAGIGTYSQPSLRLGWGNLFAIGTSIDANVKGGMDVFSVRGGITSYMAHADTDNNPANVTTAGFTVAKSRIVDPGAGVSNPADTVVNPDDLIGYYNAIAYTRNKNDSGSSYQRMGAIDFYATGSNATYGYGGNIVISTKRDGGTMSPAIVVDNNQNVAIYGSLDVKGNVTYIESTVVTIADQNITLSAGNDLALPTQANASGIQVDAHWANIQYFTSAADSTLNFRWDINKPVYISNANNSASSSSGSFVTAGGVGIGGNLNVGGSFGLTSTTEATSTNTGAFTVGGGISAAKNIIAGGSMFANSNVASTSLTSGALLVQGGAAITGNVFIGGRSTTGNTQSGLFVVTTSQATGLGTGALVVSGGASVNGNVFMADAGSANGVSILSTLNVTGLNMTSAGVQGGNATAQSQTLNPAALYVAGGTRLAGNVIIGQGRATGNVGPGRVYIDNASEITTGNIETGGLVLGNASTRVGMSVSGGINLGTTGSGVLYVLSTYPTLGVPTNKASTGKLTPGLPVRDGSGNYALGSITTNGGIQSMGNLYVGQPHDGTAYSSAGAGTWSGSYNPSTARPVGAFAGNIYVQSGTEAKAFNQGAIVIQEVTLVDGNTAAGGLGVAGNIYANGASWLGALGYSSTIANLVAASSTESTTAQYYTVNTAGTAAQTGNIANGSLVVLGGAGIMARLNVGGNIVANSGVISTSATTGAIVVPGLGGIGVGGQVTVGNNVTLLGGVSVKEPLTFTAGTLTTAANVGAVEFVNQSTSNGIFYATPAASNRAIMGATHYWVQNGNVALNNDNTPGSTNIFYGAFAGTNSTGTTGALNVPGSATYEVDVKLVIGYSATPTSAAASFTFGGTATYTSYNYDVTWSPVNSLGTPTAPFWTSFFGTTTMPSAATGVISSTQSLTNYAIRVRGIITTNAAGTILPQLSWSALPVAKIYTVAGSYFKLTPLGTTGNISIGNFRTT